MYSKEDMLYQVSLNRDICRTQAQIYEKAAYDGVDIPVFSDLYLKSHFCLKQMETLYSSFQREDADTCLYFIYKEIGDLSHPDSREIFNPDVASWVGYTYHQLYCETGVRGDVLVHQVPFSRLILNYGHHMMDETYSSDLLCRYFGLKKNDLYLQYADYLEKMEF